MKVAQHDIRSGPTKYRVNSMDCIGDDQMFTDASTDGSLSP